MSDGQTTFVRADQLEIGMYLPLAHGRVTSIDSKAPVWASTLKGPWPPYVTVDVDSDGSGSYHDGPWRFMCLQSDFVEVVK